VAQQTHSDVIDGIAAAWDASEVDVDTEPIQVVGRILRGAKLIQILGEAELTRRGLVRVDFDILSALRRSSRPQSPTELSTYLLVSPASTSQRLRKLEAAGWITRESNPQDGRGFFLELTASGRQLIEELLPRQLAAEAQLLSGLSSRARRALAEQLKSLLLTWEPVRP